MIFRIVFFNYKLANCVMECGSVPRETGECVKSHKLCQSDFSDYTILWTSLSFGNSKT